jgi:hypothetical protein
MTEILVPEDYTSFAMKMVAEGLRLQRAGFTRDMAREHFGRNDEHLLTAAMAMLASIDGPVLITTPINRTVPDETTLPEIMQELAEKDAQGGAT